MPYLSSYFRQPYLPRPATSSPSPVRDDSESPKEEDSVGAYMGCREPISRSKTYAKYRQDVPDRDAIEKAMKWTLNKTNNIQAQLKSQEAKLRDLEARISAGEADIQMRLQQLETKFDKKASDTNYYLALHGDAILGSTRAFDCLLVRRLVESMQKTVAIGLKITALTFSFFLEEEVQLVLSLDPTKKDPAKKGPEGTCDILASFGLKPDFDPLKLPRRDDVGFEYEGFKRSLLWASDMVEYWKSRVPAQFAVEGSPEAPSANQLKFLKQYVEVCYDVHRQRATDSLELAKRFTENPDLPRDVMELLSLFGDKQPLSDEEENAYAMIASFVAYETTAMKLEKAIEILENDVTLQLCAQDGDVSHAVKKYTDAAAHGLSEAPHALLGVRERIKAHGKVPLELLQLADQSNSLGTTLSRDRPTTQREVRADLGWDYDFFEERDAVRAFDELDHEQRCMLVQQIALQPLSGDPLNYSFDTKHIVPTFGSLLKLHQRQVTDTDQSQTTRSLADRVTPSSQPQATRSRVTPSGQPQTTRSLGIHASAASGSSGPRVLQGRRFHDKGKGKATATSQFGGFISGDEVAQVGGTPTLFSRLFTPTENCDDYKPRSKRASESNEGQGSRKRSKKGL